MELRLDDEEATELAQLLADTLRELSSEIANTDNAEYRRTLRARRERLEHIVQALGAERQERGA
jgi:hypothetical protein